MEDSPSTSKPHLLLIPYPLQGHIIPAVHLALKLAAAGFSVTFVNTEAVHHHIRSSVHDGDHEDIFASSSLDIRYELVGDGLPVTFDRSLNHDEFMLELLHTFHGNVEALARRLPRISGLVADTFFVWPATLARSLGIPYISFWTEPALVFSLYYHMDLLRHHGHFAAQGVVELARVRIIVIADEEREREEEGALRGDIPPFEKLSFLSRSGEHHAPDTLKSFLEFRSCVSAFCMVGILGLSPLQAEESVAEDLLMDIVLGK